MTEDDKLNFFAGMETVRNGYPNFDPREERWGEIVTGYFRRLSRYDYATVAEGVERAVKSSTEYFPGIGLIAECCEAIDRPRREYARTQKLIAQPDGPKALPPEITPSTERRSRFNSLADAWEVESAKLGLDPDKATPQHIYKRRLKELMDLLYEENDLSFPGKRDSDRKRSRDVDSETRPGRPEVEPEYVPSPEPYPEDVSERAYHPSDEVEELLSSLDRSGEVFETTEGDSSCLDQKTRDDQPRASGDHSGVGL